MNALCRVALAAATLSLAACASVGPFVWADEYLAREEAAGAAYRIAPGDLLAVRVYNQEAMSARERVRGDGMVSLPLLRDVQAAGLAPNALAEIVQERLKQYINQPVVTVAVQESRPVVVPVLGEVARQGNFPLDNGATVLDALAAAGGLNDFAHRDRLFLLRREDGKLLRIRCTFEALSRGQGRASELRLRPGDTVVVE